MIKISLTDLIDFVSKVGSTKLTLVNKVKNRDDYHPALDFYKVLRDGIIENHINGGNKKDLEEMLITVHPKKKDNFQEAIQGYKKFWGRKDLQWIEPVFKHWQIDDLNVKINPELGLIINGKPHIIKLYLKSDKLSKNKSDQILALLESELRRKAGKQTAFCVLDVRQGKLYCNEERRKDLIPLLVGEAKSFVSIWNSLDE